MKLMVLVPAFNEEGNIEQLVEDIHKYLPEGEILVVNDCSTDDTEKSLRRMKGVRFLSLPFNMGIGGAVLSGFNYMFENGYDRLIRLDGDGQHPPDQAVSILGPVRDGSVDVAVGSRYLDGETAYSSFTRKLGIKLLSFLSAMILRKKMTDSTSGFRAYNRKVIEFLIRDYPYDYPEPEEIYLLTKAGFRIEEVPVVMKERETGVSSIGFIHTGYFLIKILITIFVKYAIGGKRNG